MYFEDFVTEKRIVTPEKQISANDVDAFLDIFGLHLPMFMGDQGAQRIGHEQRLVPGPMILSAAMGLVKKTGWFDHVVALLELNDVHFEKALYPGHAVKADITIKKTRRTQNPKRGLVVLAFKVINQNDEVILSGEGKYLIRTRHPSSSPM